MNYRRIVVAAITTWVASIPLGAFVHHGLLGRVYAADAGVFRPDADVLRRLPVGYGVQLFGFLAASLMFAEMSSSRSGVLRGIRFGLLTSVLVISFAVVWNYITLPISAAVGTAEAVESI